MKTRTIEEILSTIVRSEQLHAKWLNTLSYLENCGARKIAACEHPTQVKEEMLKHAAEEFRHAHHLKRQISKISPLSFNTYAMDSLLGGMATLHYLSVLDVKTSRYLSKDRGLPPRAVKEVSYLLVTYAIELRAEHLYPLYHATLKDAGSKVTIRSILMEEKEHLEEMRRELAQLPLGDTFSEHVCCIESQLFRSWIGAVGEGIDIDQNFC